VAVAIVGTSVDTGVAVARTAAAWPPLRAVAWRPPVVPARWQPATLVEGVARRGAAYRLLAARHLERLLDRWAPLLVESVVSRLDLTGLVAHHVDLDEVARGLDLEAVIERIDLDAIVRGIDLDSAVEGVDLEAIVRRIDLDGAVARVDLDAAVRGVDIDAIAGRLDLDAVIERIDLVRIVQEVIDEVDLPGIIRDSTGSMASEAVRSARMTGISADDALSRGLERRLFRRRATGTASEDRP
jgi:hypothetical protein